jgi:hypothetical protein
MEFVHVTRSANIPAILHEGLQVGMPVEIMAGEDWTADWYDENPVYLSMPGSLFLTALADLPEAGGMAGIDVDAAGLPLAADLVSLVDHGGRYLPEGYIQWRTPEAAGPLAAFLDEHGCVEIEHLLDPRSDMALAAIELTRTATCLATIGPERLAVDPSDAWRSPRAVATTPNL